MNAELKLKILREIMGYVEDGSNDTVRIWQDDVTKDFFIVRGKRLFFSSSLDHCFELWGKHLGLIP